MSHHRSKVSIVFASVGIIAMGCVATILPQLDMKSGQLGYAAAYAQGKSESAPGRSGPTPGNRGNNGKSSSSNGNGVALDEEDENEVARPVWRASSTATGNEFRNHGQRVRSLVAIAKALGYPASAGALQGNFGTPQEILNDDELVAFFAGNPDGETMQKILAAKPGSDSGAWATYNLDVNNDGVVDSIDLEIVRSGAGQNGGNDEEDSGV